MPPIFVPAEVTVKILDLATRRYYAGKVKITNDSAMEIELPPTARLQAGCSGCEFIIAGQQSLVGATPRCTPPA